MLVVEHQWPLHALDETSEIEEICDVQNFHKKIKKMCQNLPKQENQVFNYWHLEW